MQGYGHSRVESVTKAAAVAESSTGFALGGFQAKLFPSSAQHGEGVCAAWRRGVILQHYLNTRDIGVHALVFFIAVDEIYP